MGWTKSLYPQVREKFLAIDEDKRNEMSVADIEDLIGDDPDYHFFSWCERHLQKLKYSGAYGLHPFHKERSETLTDELREEEIERAESFILPDYYKAIDIHQQPGGVWSDPVAGFIYERGARTTRRQGKAVAAARGVPGEACAASCAAQSHTDAPVQQS